MNANHLKKILKFPRKITEEIELRILMPQHAQAFLNVVDHDRDYLNTTVPWPNSRKTLSDVTDYFDRVLKLYEDGQGFCVGIFASNQFSGEIKVHTIDWEQGEAEIGYWLGAESRGKGIATLATQAITDVLLNDLGLKKVLMTTSVANIKSQAIPERLGFHKKNLFEENAICYFILKDEWNAK